jgi:hypothetical protein
MKELSTYSSDVSQDSRRVPSYLNKPKQKSSRFLGWWYRIASPPEPDSLASFETQEKFRRGRTGSQIILALYLLTFVSIPAGLAGTNPFLTTILICVFFALLVATVLNRIGKVAFAGVVVVIAFIAEPTLNIVTTPGGLNMMVLPIYGLLVLPLVCTVTFLPPWWVFVVAAGNCLFTWYSLTYLSLTAELNATLEVAFASIVTPIVISQAIVSVVAYIWVQGASKALGRADRAEELVKLEHDLALQARAATQQKDQLETSIQKIVDTHMRVANGDFDARVPLTEDNLLWQISGSLNNLLSRTQRLRQESARLQQVEQSLHQAREENRRLLQRIERH